ANAMALPITPYQTSQGGTTAHANYIDDRIDNGNWTITPGVRYESINYFNNVSNLGADGSTVTSQLFPKAEARELLPTLSVL
ncbi:TonB-dependent receptor domain-containing protein, partial [Klebsiella pneumoniae]|uniref:TonB-dependent receptor domain-containing protein n=1 Tax=Klebsiella pneumoniae TaxID=573 RepID=UPI002731C8AE